MTHRPPTAADIGREDAVEILVPGHKKNWHKGTILAIEHDGKELVCRNNVTWRVPLSSVRVPYLCPDPIAELSMSADKLVELGAPEAARVLMLWLSMSDRDRERLNNYQAGDSVSVFRTLLDELTGRRSWRSVQLLTPNPEPQP